MTICSYKSNIFPSAGKQLMNTNSRFPKCLFKSFSTVFVASFYLTYRYCSLKLPIVAKKAKLERPVLSACVWLCARVCVCMWVFFFSVSLCFSFGLVSWLPGNHDCACLLPSCFWVQLRYLVSSHEYIICWLLVLY